MNKLYERIDFVNDTTPALNDSNLNLMSKAIDDIDDRVIEVSDDIMVVVPQIQEMLQSAEALVTVAKASANSASISADNAEHFAEEAAAGSGGNNLAYADEMLQLKRDNVVLSAVHISGGGGGGSNEWVGTHAEYEAIKDTIPDGYFVTFTDDANPLETYAIVNSSAEVLINDEDDVIAGAKAVKDFQTYSTEETVCGEFLGKTRYRKTYVSTLPTANGTAVEKRIPLDITYSKILDIGGTQCSSTLGVTQPILTISNAKDNISKAYVDHKTDELALVNTFASWNNAEVNVTIEYTKE